MLLAKQMRWQPAAAAASNASMQQQLQKKRGAKAATALTVCADDVAGEERLVKLRGGRRVGREVDDRVDALAGCVSLKTLELEGCELDDISALSDLS